MALPLRRRPRRSGGVRRTRPSIPCPAALENKADKSLTRLKEDRQPACVPNASRPLKARKHGPLPWYRSGRRLGNFRANRPVTPWRVRSGPGHRPLWVESPPATAELNVRSPASCQCLLLALGRTCKLANRQSLFRAWRAASCGLEPENQRRWRRDRPASAPSPGRGGCPRRAPHRQPWGWR